MKIRLFVIVVLFYNVIFLINSYPFDSGIMYHSNGNVKFVNYEVDNGKYTVYEWYYENGNMKEREQYLFEERYLNTKHIKLEFRRGGDHRIGKQTYYYENGNLKEVRCYTPVVNKDEELESVLCGDQIFYDEQGKEIRRIKHKVPCEYGCEEAPRRDMKEVVEEVRKRKEQQRMAAKIIKWNNKPVVGQIVSVDKNRKEVTVRYCGSNALKPGDQIFHVFNAGTVNNVKVVFECRDSDQEKGYYALKEDTGDKFSDIKSDMEVRYYKKTEILNQEFLKRSKKYKAGDTEVIGDIEFVYIPGGAYLFENPRIKKKIKPFWISKYEMTVGEFLKFVYDDKGGGFMKSAVIDFNSRMPVNMGTYWEYAVKYCNWFSYKYKVKAREPEWTEWIYAAKEGKPGDQYFNKTNLNDYCWYSRNSGNKLHPVGQKKPNAFGLYDMFGNAWEWCDSSTLHGGSSSSGLNELQDGKTYTMAFKDYNDPAYDFYKKIADQGTSFRIVIEAE